MSPTTLYDYYTAQGKALPSVSERAAAAASAGITGYTGSADQNTKLLNYLTANTGAAPAPAPTTKPTLADTYKTVTVPGLSTTTTGAQNQNQQYQQQSQTPVDENAIRNSTLAMYQAQIDALNQVYAQKYAEADKAATGRQGSTRAIDARSGLLGSDFADAHAATTDANNAAIRGTIDASKNADISAIYGKASSDAATQIAAAKKAKEDAADKYLQTLGAVDTSKKSDLSALAKALLAQGVKSTKDISPADLKTIADKYGIDASTIDSLLVDATNAQATSDAALATAKKNSLINVTDGTALIDPTTGKPVYNNIKDFKPGTAGGSSVDAPASGSISNDMQAILEGRNTMYNIRQTMGRNNQAAAYMQTLRDSIAKIDPQFDFVASDAGGKSVSTSYVQRATASINSVLPNIDKIVDLSNQVQRIGVTGVDKLLQAGQVVIGNQKVSNFHEAQKLIADEIGVALGAGTVSDMKLQLGFDVTNPNVSQEVFASNMGVVKEFVQNRLAGLNSLRYKSSTVGSNGADNGSTPSSATTKVKMTGPNGTIGYVDQEKVAAAQQAGYTITPQ